MAFKHTVTINDVDLTADIVGNSYTTAAVPVYSESVTTLDGVEHKVKIRDKGQVSFDLSPVTEERLAEIAQALLSLPASVTYYSLQHGAERTATMVLDNTSASALYRIIHQGSRWGSIASIQLTEL